MTTSPKDILQKVFGYSEFRPIQEEIIDAVLAGEDSLVILPTGGGKSLCYQIPALALPGLTIVISPLIALMDDQVIALRELGVEAAAIHSNLDYAEKAEIASAIGSGKLKLLYMAPESLLTASFLEFIQQREVNLLAIDEAHCISVWGNDFRPEYTRLSSLKDRFPGVPVIALTATADAATRDDICEQLRIPDARRFVASFERPNLMARAMPGQSRFQRISGFLRDRQGQSGIIYCLSRKSTEKIAAKVNGLGIPAAAYHAGMDARTRRDVQAKFQDDRIQVVCATIAFGMGIDKSNVRFVIHFNMPKNIESYYQEMGRAGRDGEPADTLLFYSWADMIMLRGFVRDSEANEDFKRVQMAKLDRIWEYANAYSCRTNLILNYFGEYRSESCGHCDNCLRPPERFEGTQLAQMALSAVARTNEDAGLNMLIDILRGSGKSELRQAGFDRIKTFGVGRHLPYLDWKSYITQIINQGLLSIDYKEKGVLRLTPMSARVLQGESEVMLTKFTRDKPVARKAPEPATPEDGLFQKLRNWRLQVSRSKGVPAYAVLNDRCLKGLAAHKPLTNEDLLAIDGIGPVKMEQYGEVLIGMIRSYIEEHEVP